MLSRLGSALDVETAEADLHPESVAGELGLSLDHLEKHCHSVALLGDEVAEPQAWEPAIALSKPLREGLISRDEDRLLGSDVLLDGRVLHAGAEHVIDVANLVAIAQEVADGMVDIFVDEEDHGRRAPTRLCAPLPPSALVFESGVDILGRQVGERAQDPLA